MKYALPIALLCFHFSASLDILYDKLEAVTASLLLKSHLTLSLCLIAIYLSKL